jgi:hypothetical protein
MRFIHSADWQIGKVFKQFGPKEESLRQARLAAIERLGELATAHETFHVLVAGDVYDNEAPSPITLRTPIERMRSFPAVRRINPKLGLKLDRWDFIYPTLFAVPTFCGLLSQLPSQAL